MQYERKSGRRWSSLSKHSTLLTLVRNLQFPYEELSGNMERAKARVTYSMANLSLSSKVLMSS